MMKGRFVILMAFVTALFSCTREEELQDAREASAEGEKVTVHIHVPVTEPSTKALEDVGELKTLHLAVFGGSGYLKEYVEATPVARIDDYQYQTTDKDGTPVYLTVPAYSYQAVITLSDSPRTVHFLGNGPSVLPFGYDTSVMPVQCTAEREMGFWQMLYLPKGIKAKRNAAGRYINAAGEEIPDGGSGYVADGDTEAAFQEIPLIRNWSKIELKADDNSNFVPESFAIVNTPARGSIAPYSAGTGFLNSRTAPPKRVTIKKADGTLEKVDYASLTEEQQEDIEFWTGDYHERSFTELDTEVAYPGNLPVGTTFLGNIPELDAFTPAEGAVYLYERPIPSANVQPSFILIYGQYTDPEAPDGPLSGKYFYKVDLMESKHVVHEGDEPDEWESHYYPIYRNFKYQVIVKKIVSPGFSTPQAAAHSAGSADVSADINTSGLADISDGIGRLQVTWMSKTFTEAHDEGNPIKDLKVYFSHDGEEGCTLKAALLPCEDGGADILTDLQLSDRDDNGWRSLTFHNAAPGRTVRSQTIRVTGVHTDGRLYRDIVVTIQPIQQMKVQCEHARVAPEMDQSQCVIVSIPDGLVESMFPLQFTIEAEDKTLTPDNTKANNNLPVISAPSISTNGKYAGKQTFQFVRTISWADYLTLPREQDEEEKTWRVFHNYFRTNAAESGTRIWVYNSYFDMATDAFVNFKYKVFQNLGFTTPIPQESEAEIPVSFEMVEDDDVIYPAGYPVITIVPRGLRLALGNGITPGDDPGTYFYQPTGHNVTLTFISTTPDAKEFAVDFRADEYDPGHIETLYFPSFGFLDGRKLVGADKWSNVAWGYVNTENGKTVIFTYQDHPSALNAPVRVTLKSLKKSTSDSKQSLIPVPSESSTYIFTPSGPVTKNALDQSYHEINLDTVGGYFDVSVKLEANGYVTETVTAGRFEGNIRTMKITNGNVLKSGNSYGFSAEEPTFTYSEDNGKCKVTFSEIAEDPKGYVVLAAGETYEMTVSSENDGQYLMYVDMHFRTDKGVEYLPESVELLDGVGTITHYPGDKFHYVLNTTTRMQRAVTVKLKAPEDHDIQLDQMWVKSFNRSTKPTGGFYENAVKISDN